MPVTAGALFAAVTVLRFSAGSAVDGYSLLYVLPIALMGLRYELAGGLGAAGLALVLVASWASLDDVGITAAGYATRAVAFGVLGGLVGWETRQRRRLAAEHQRLLARAQATPGIDGLTGLPNRRAWNEALHQQRERSRRDWTAFSVALVDLDRFKAFNDHHGHGQGDDLLRQAASAWRSRVRTIDVLARHGGEEFAVLLPACAADHAVDVVERLRSATPLGQTASGGIAHWDGHETSEALVERADRALYVAKRTGRDRCVVVGPW